MTPLVLAENLSQAPHTAEAIGVRGRANEYIKMMIGGKISRALEDA